MAFPEFIGWEEVEDVILEDFICYVCQGPMFRAVNTACRHRLCDTCSARLVALGDERCGLCRQPRNVEEDERLSERIREYVKLVVLSKAQALLQARHLELDAVADSVDFSAFMDSTTMRLNMTALEQAVMWHTEFVAREVAGVTGTAMETNCIVVCTSLGELASVPENNGVLACELTGNWLTDMRPLSKFRNVQMLRLSGCTELATLSGIDGLTSLTHLFVEDCGVVFALGVERCPHLGRIVFTRCPHLSGFVLPQQQDGPKVLRDASPVLDEVCVVDCPLLEMVVATPFSVPLSEFTAHNTALQHLRSLRFCTALERLDVSGCDQLTDISAIADLRRLTKLDVSETAVENLTAFLSQLTQLTEVRMSGCNVQGDLRELGGAHNLKVLVATRTALTSLAGISQCLLLERIDVDQCASLKDLSGLSGLTHLMYVDASLTAVNDISSLEGCAASLKELRLWGSKVSDISVLRNAAQLEILDLDKTLVTNITPLAKCVASLKKLFLENCKVSDISVLNNAGWLEIVNLSNTLVTHIKPLARCVASLEDLRLQQCTVGDISVLQDAERLEILDLDKTLVTEIKSLAKCAKTLKKLFLCQCGVSDISVLQTAELLELLDLDETLVTDITPLAVCAASLKLLYLRQCKVSDIAVLRNAERLETVDLRETNVTDFTALPASVLRLS